MWQSGNRDTPLAGDNTEKNMGASVFGKAKNDCSWGSRGSCKPPGGPRQGLVKAWV